MCTIVSIPKPCVGLTAVHQANALLSWRSVYPDAKIYLYGNEEGVGALAKSYDAVAVTSCQVSKFGTPMLDFVFDDLQSREATGPIFFTNADMIYGPDAKILERSSIWKGALVVGTRFNIDLNQALVSAADIPAIASGARKRGDTSQFYGSDYFVFESNRAFRKLPPFAVGRIGWDNWMIYHARRCGLKVIDASPSVTALHQNHGYAHIPNKAEGSPWAGPESDENLKYLPPTIYNILDATHRLKGCNLSKARFRQAVWHKLGHDKEQAGLKHWRWRIAVGILGRLDQRGLFPYTPDPDEWT